MRYKLFLTFLLLFAFANPRIANAQSLQGDANGDGRVDGIDFALWLSHYNQNIGGSTNGDFNGSGKVDGVDYSIWLFNYGKTSTPTPTTHATNTPTPTRIPTTPPTSTPSTSGTPAVCYVKLAGYIYNMIPAVGNKLIDPNTGKTHTHSRGDFRCGTLTNPTDVTAVYLDKHGKLGCAQRVAPYIVTPPAPADPSCQ